MQAVALILTATMLAGDLDWDGLAPTPARPAQRALDARALDARAFDARGGAAEVPPRPNAWEAAVEPVQFQPDPSFGLHEAEPAATSTPLSSGEDNQDIWERPGAHPAANPSFLPVPREAVNAPSPEADLAAPLPTAPTPIRDTTSALRDLPTAIRDLPPPLRETRPPAEPLADALPRPAEPSAARRLAAPEQAPPEQAPGQTLPSGSAAAVPPAREPAARSSFAYDDLQEPAHGGPNDGGQHFLTLLALFGSIGLNIYLGWVAWDTYNRYHDLVVDMRRGSQRSREDRRAAKPAA